MGNQMLFSDFDLVLGLLTKLSLAVLICRHGTGVNDNISFLRASSCISIGYKRYSYEKISDASHSKQLTTTPNSYWYQQLLPREVSFTHPLCGRDASEKRSAIPPHNQPASPPLSLLPPSSQAPKAGHSNKGHKEETNWYMILVMGWPHRFTRTRYVIITKSIYFCHQILL